MMTSNHKSLAQAIKAIDAIVAGTSCPDPGEGGCIGGAIGGYGCVNEAAWSALRRLKEVELFSERMDQLRSSLAGMLESYDLASKNMLGITGDVMKGYFVGEIEKARKLLDKK